MREAKAGGLNGINYSRLLQYFTINKSLLHFLRRDSLVSPLTSWPQILPEIMITIPFEKHLTFYPYELNSEDTL